MNQEMKRIMEALMLALEALYNMVEDGDRTDKQQAMLAITSIEKTLAQLEQGQVQPNTFAQEPATDEDLQMLMDRDMGDN